MKGESARAVMAGPRSEPPMPKLTMSVKRWPLAATTTPSRTASAKAKTLRRSARTSGITSRPAANIGAPERLRRAMCSAGRCSVTLTGSPAKSAARRASTSAAQARSIRRPSVSSSRRCFEKSNSRSSSSTWKRSNRCGSQAKRSAMVRPHQLRRCASSAAQAFATSLSGMANLDWRRCGYLTDPFGRGKGRRGLRAG